MIVSTEVDSIIKDSLTQFCSFISLNHWYGREREAISLYVMGFLTKMCKEGSFLCDPRQIGIEVAVPQIPSPNSKPQVNKDLVIWPEPAMVCWNDRREPANHPICIMEWKANQQRKSTHDISWLRQYSSDKQNLVCYGVNLNIEAERHSLLVDRIYLGECSPSWLSL